MVLKEEMNMKSIYKGKRLKIPKVAHKSPKGQSRHYPKGVLRL